MTTPAHAREWMRQRLAGARAVAEVEEAELANLDDATALRLADALLSAVSLTPLDEERRTSSGLVEQQRLFARATR